MSRSEKERDCDRKMGRNLEVKNKTVLITGAANGIGKCLAELFAKKKTKLILWDKDSIGLDLLKKKLEKNYGVIVFAFVLDITDNNALIREFQQICYFRSEEIGLPDIVINNAGIGLNEPIQDTDVDTWNRIFDINFFSAVKISVTSMAALKAHRQKYNDDRRLHIVNICSGQSFFRLPTWTSYATTKAALAVFSESLGIEAKKDGIDITTVYPFMVNTGFYEGVEEKSSTWMGKMSMRLLPLYSNEPETVARKIIAAIEKKKPVEMINPLNWVGYHLNTVPMVGRIVRSILNKVFT